MDYAIVLIPRVKEEHDLPGDQSAAVVSGPCRTSGMIIAAACILAVVSAAIWTSRVTNIKMLGPGLLSSVPVDASAVHCALMPAALQLAGLPTWCAPGPLPPGHQRFGFAEEAARPIRSQTVSDHW